ncbi:MAG: DUF5723 family protein [Cryomorphaceae bacterium]
MKTALTLTGAFICTLFASAQMENAAFTETGRGASHSFATDYHALGINPGNLGLGNPYNKKFTLGLGQVGTSLYSEGFTREQLWQGLTDVEAELTTAEKQQAALDFAGSDYSLSLYSTIFGFAVNTDIGNFAFSMNLRGSYFSNFNDEGASQLFNGYVDSYFDRWEVRDPDGGTSVIANGGPNSERIDDVVLGFASDSLVRQAADLYRDSRLKAMAFMEYNLGYGRNVYESEDVSIYAGVGLKFMQGLFVADINTEGGRVVDAYASASPTFDIDFGNDQETNPSFQDDGLSVGNGFGFDFGITAEIADQFRVSASMTDIGSITFDGNVYQSGNAPVFDIETQGIDSYNVFSNFDTFTGDDGAFPWIGKRNETVLLPTQFRTGLAYFHDEKLRVGLDLAFPMNEAPGNIERMAFAFGAEYLVASSVSLSAGVGAGDNFGFRVPFGVNFVIGEGSWEFGVATRDLMYALRDDRPNLSVVTGLLRFRFGDMTEENPSRMY